MVSDTMNQSLASAPNRFLFMRQTRRYWHSSLNFVIPFKFSKFCAFPEIACFASPVSASCRHWMSRSVLGALHFTINWFLECVGWSRPEVNKSAAV
jgi:hypothetical protein